MGLFAVWKKGGEIQRIICDARACNRLFNSPPHVDLCNSEVFSRVESSGHEGEDLIVDISDVKDFFHHLRLPPELRR
eukprot:3644363-Amphidinium_carterae.1